MLKGFRDFVFRGNVVDLAVAVIIGAAFTGIVTSFVTNIITPLIAAIVGKPDFSAFVLHLNGGVITYGIFLNSVISFLLVATVVYFLIVAPMNYVLSRFKHEEAAAAPVTKVCPQCLSEIPLGATRCKFCTEPQPA
jgi:large conductance mechanosensitive channel